MPTLNSPHHFRVLSIDPGTKIAGVSLLSFSRHGGDPGLLLAKTAIDASHIQGTGATDIRARIARIAFIRRQLSQLIADFGFSFDYLSYEQAFGTREASMAIHHATGAYLTLSCFSGIEIIRVHTSSVKAVYGNSDLAFAVNVDGAARAAKREKLKANVVLWANRRYDLQLKNSENDIADAIAIGCAARKIICQNLDTADTLAANPPMFGPGSRGPRTPKPKTVEVVA